MKHVGMICQKCGQQTIVEVDEEGLEFIGLERLRRLFVCQRCADLRESERRSDYYARKFQPKPNEPF